MPYPTLKIGSKGADVVHLKALLASRGHHPPSDDQNYYKATAEAVSVYQATNLGPKGRFLLEEGETAGEVGELTWRSLSGEFSGMQQPVPQPVSPKPVPPKVQAGARYRFLDTLAKWWKDGVREKPKGSNSDNGGLIDAMHTWHGIVRQPWCAMAVNYAYFKTFGTPPPWGKVARVCTIWNWAHGKGMAFTDTSKMRPGDLGVYISAPLRSSGKAPDVNGHIFAITGTPKSRVLGLDGNSDDRLRATDRGRSYLTGFIRFLPEENLTFNLSGYETGDASDR